MTLSQLVIKATKVACRVTSADWIPVTINGERVKIVDITLEGENGDYTADIKVDI